MSKDCDEMAFLLKGSLGGDSEDSLLESLDDRALEGVAREAPFVDEDKLLISGSKVRVLVRPPIISRT